MLKLAIIADNLIGANDAGVQFKKIGLNVQVITNWENILEYCDDAQIVSVNTNSRKISPRDAYERVYQTGKNLTELGFKRFYKKIDSTLRGNIAEEIRAMLDSLSLNAAIVTPAYPVYGRIVKNGYLELLQNWDENSVSVPVCYIPPLAVPESETSAVLALAQVREGHFSLKQKITDIITSGAKLIIADAETKEDLDTIALAVNNLDAPLLVVGSAGLADSLSEVWLAPSLTLPALRRGTVIISGTLNQATAEQIENIQNLDKVKLIKIKSSLVYNEKADEELARIVSIAQEALRAEKIPVVIVDTLLENRDDINALSMSLYVRKFGVLITAFLGKTAQKLANECHLRHLIVVGDGTVTSICQALEAKKINLVRELLAGIPLGIVSGGSADGLYLVTKAGGFGEPFSLRKILELL